MAAQDVQRTLPKPHTVDEVMNLVPLPSQPGAEVEIKRFAGLCPAWRPGADLPLNRSNTGRGKGLMGIPKAAFGGHVYAQAGLAACRVVREAETMKGIIAEDERLGFHSIHGYFTSIGLSDRPYIYSVTYITTGVSFATLRIDARQPTTASSPPHTYPFPLADARKPLGRICFTAIVSFKSPGPHSGGVCTQEASVQERFREILAQRKPDEWPRSPPIDIETVNRTFGTDLPSTFPMIEMHKVDMTAWNKDRAAGEKMELILYRLLKSEPRPGVNDGEQDGAYGIGNLHSLIHAFGADRNGIPMLCNLHEMYDIGKAASLTYSYTAHTNVVDGVMGRGEEHDGWWVQETSFPRVAHGRGIVTSKIWSPKGVHVASTYQDAVARVQGDEQFQQEMARAARKSKGKI